MLIVALVLIHILNHSTKNNLGLNKIKGGQMKIETGSKEMHSAILKVIEEHVDGKKNVRSERVIPIEGYTVSEVADSLRVSEKYVWELVWSGQLASFRVGKDSKLVRISHDALKQFRMFRESEEASK